MTIQCDPFWVSDPMLLLRIDRLIEFYPSLDMCGNERVNAITRFILYCGICISFVKKNLKPMTLSLAIISTIAFLYHPKSDKKMLEIYFENKQSCTQPTDNNPFMNILPFDAQFKNKVNLPPCEYSEKFEKKFQNKNDFYRVNDGKTFNNVPSQSQGDYLHYLYQGNIGSCKNAENLKDCRP